MKRILLLACAPVKETYENILIMLKKLCFETWDFEYKFIADLCAINKLCGIGNHCSSFPCYICIWQAKNGFLKGAQKRDMGSLEGKDSWFMFLLS